MSISNMFKKPSALPLCSTSAGRVARQTLWMGTITVAQFLSGVALLALSARILGPEGFGVLAIFMSTATIFYAFLTVSGHEAITAFVTRSVTAGQYATAAATLRMAFATVQGLALLAYALLAAFALAASELVGIAKTHVAAMLVCGLAGLLMATHRESLAALRLANQLPLGLTAVVAGGLVRTAALLAVWRAGGGLMMVSLAIVAGAAVTGAWLFAAAAASAGRDRLPRFLTGWSVRVPRDVVRFQLLSFCQTKVGALYGHLDVILLGALVGPVQAGIYRAARRLVDVTTTPMEPLSLSVQAEYSRRWYAFDGIAFRRLSRRFTMLAIALAVATYGLLIVLYRPVIRIALGSEFEDAARPLLIMVPGAFALVSVAALRVLPASTGRALPSLIWTSAALAAQLTVLLILVPTHGAAGAAWAYTVYQLVLAAVVVVFAVATRRHSRRGERAGPQTEENEGHAG